MKQRVIMFFIVSETLLTVEDVAGRLKLHRVTVRRFITEGRIRAVKFSGRFWRIPESAVQEFIEAQADIPPLKIESPGARKVKQQQKKRTKRPSS